MLFLVLHSSTSLQGIHVLAKNQTKSHTHTGVVSVSVIWAGTQSADSTVYVSSWWCAVFCVCAMLLPCRGLCPIITPLPPLTHTASQRLGQQPRLKQRETKLTMICRVTKRGSMRHFWITQNTTGANQPSGIKTFQCWATNSHRTVRFQKITFILKDQ